MSFDANKTDLTRQITERAATWLSERGFKPVESEVPIAQRWVADIAGVGNLTYTEAINMKLVTRRPRDVAWSEYKTIPGILTAAIEVKVSRSDFARDDKWTRDPATHLLYLAAPSELFNKISVPEEVGLLSCGKELVRCVRPAKIRPLTDQQIAGVVHQIAVRRDHFTAYERFREFQRQARSEGNERSNKASLQHLMQVCLDITSGRRTPEEAVAWHGVKIGKAHWVFDQLRELAPKAKEC